MMTAEAPQREALFTPTAFCTPCKRDELRDKPDEFFFTAPL
jgi:hypothetical protein